MDQGAEEVGQIVVPFLFYRTQRQLPSPTWRVVYIAGEGAHGIPARVKAWEIEHGLVGRVGRQFALVQEAIPFDIADGGARERLEKLRDELRRTVSKHGPISLIIIDTLSSLLTTDENDNQAVAAFLRTLKTFAQEFGAAVLINHHPPKAVVGARGAALSRGASAFVNNVDGGLYLERKKGLRVLSHKVKDPRDGAPGKPIAFTVKSISLPADDDGNPRDSLVLVAAPLPSWWRGADEGDIDEEKAEPKRERPVRSQIVKLLTTRGPLPWASITAALNPTREANHRKRLERARNELRDEGYIAPENNDWKMLKARD